MCPTGKNDTFTCKKKHHKLVASKNIREHAFYFKIIQSAYTLVTLFCQHLVPVRGSIISISVKNLLISFLAEVHIPFGKKTCSAYHIPYDFDFSRSFCAWELYRFSFFGSDLATT